MKTNYTIVPLTQQLIKDVANIHSESLPDDFLPNLGFDFLVETFYPSTLRSDRGKVFIAVDENSNPEGFVLVTVNSGDFLKGILKDRLLDFLKVGIRSSFSSFSNFFNNFQIVISGLFSTTTQNAGEIYVIAVKNSSQGKGIGKLLVNKSIEFLQECGIHVIRIKTLESNIKWIGFFKKNGWETEKEFHLIGNNYVSLFAEID
ncbi:MAG: GNAT family N-acetyltransferase [Pelolinea sp.]|nr:GNAT family N-acetyltransferase [Pelolinea sp.]